MIKTLFKEYFDQYGKEVSGYVMENGETRFRFSTEDSAYIRTESGGLAWQKSHYHSEQTEHFIVEKGNVSFATLRDGITEIHKYSAGETFSVRPMVSHNLQISPGGIVHTVKCGGKMDWYACSELDEYLKNGDSDGSKEDCIFAWVKRYTCKLWRI